MDKSPARSRRHPAREAAKVDSRSTGALPKQSAQRALVVEADPATRQLSREILEGAGFLVDAVDSGIAAVIAAREGLPDLILIDLQLPDVPGREAVGWLRSNPALRSTPIIVLTTNTDDDAEVAALRPGASLRKPISPIAIRHAIREVLRKEGSPIY
jgi:DNA-binding response OmpR family regulator